MSDAYDGWTEAPADPHAGWTETPAAKPRMGFWPAVAAGLGQVPAGLGDEAGALSQAMAEGGQHANGPAEMNKNMLDVYRQARFENQAESRQAADERPWPYYGALALGTLATAPALPAFQAAKGAGVGLRLAAAAANGLTQGGAFGLGMSEGDLTRGEVGRVASDVGKFALGGGLLGVGGGLVTEGLGAASRALQGAADKATARGVAMGQKAAAAETASARGQLGSLVTQGNRTVENLQRLKATGNATAEQLAELEALRPQVAALEQRLMDSNLKSLPEIVPKIDEAQAALEGLAPQSERAAAVTADRMSWGSALNRLGARAMRYGPAFVGGALGHKLFGHAGLGYGATAGLVLRPAIRSMLRLAADPAVLPRVAGPTARLLGKVAPAAETVGGRLGPAVERDALPQWFMQSPTAGWAEVPAEDPQSALAAALRRRANAP